jgi:competence protein ComEC
MGGAGVLASMAGRRASRLYALLLALGVTLAVDPGIAADIGWQLSFAAVTGIFLLAPSLREAIAARLGSSGWRRVLAEGAAVTIAATLATGPLIAFHFETLSTTTLVANLLAMPAVAAAMWLGMATAAAAQIPGLPVEALNWINALLLGYIAQVAAWWGRPSWAEVRVRLGLGGLAASYLGIALAALTWMRFARAKRIAAARAGGPTRGSPFIRIAVEKPAARVARSLFALLALFVAGIGAWMAIAPGADGGTRPVSGLRVEVLDVGQGDAILLQPAAAPAVLVDGGPPGDGLAGKLEEAGIERLGAAVVTHDQSDHAGGIEELLGRLPVDRLVYARLGRPLLERARAVGAVPVRAAAGAELHSGALRLQVLWPPPELLEEPVPGSDPNQLALVLLARWRDFTMLLSADAEAEAVPLDPGPLDVLKVAHHGSDDAGLAALLERTRPRLAVISVGDDNPYGHPAISTLATLAEHRVRIMRTDRDGDVVIEIFERALKVD